MEFAHLGGYIGEIIPNVDSKWAKQINETEVAVAKNPLRLFPMFSYDPRRYRFSDNIAGKKGCKNWMEPFLRIIGNTNQSTPSIWIGFSMNPLLGFRPFDELCGSLPIFYTGCRDNIPILAHCAPGGITTHDAKKYKTFDKENGLERVEKSKERNKLMGLTSRQETHCSNMYCGTENVVKDTDLDHFYRNYGHPRNWIPVLKIFPDLRLCLSGFGGNSEWKHDAMSKWRDCETDSLPPREWIRCIIKLTRYKNVYADISGLDIYDHRVSIALMKMLGLIQKDNNEFKHLKYKLIFGSDWYLTQHKENLTTYNQSNRTFGLHPNYADCSSTTITALCLAGQGGLFKTAVTGQGNGYGIQEEIMKMHNTINKTSITNNLTVPYRKETPCVGDIMMWKGHIGVVTDVTDSAVFWANMGVKTGPAIQRATLNSLEKDANVYSSNFWGFWTPNDYIIEELAIDDTKNKPTKDIRWCCDKCETKYASK